jgi:HlyD family secretion protein
MAKIPKKALKWWILGAVALLAVVLVGLRYWQVRRSALPSGIASGNGRLEARLVDVVAKEPLRVKEILVDEGALVSPNQVLVQLDTSTLDAELAQAEASVAAAQEHMAVSQAAIVKQRSEIQLAEIEVKRSTNLVAQGAGSQRELDVRRTRLETTKATLGEAEAALRTAREQVEVARANVATVQTRIDDATLKAPITGRVLYRLAEPGEVLAAGGKALTLVNLDDVYMEIFLPSAEAAKAQIGADARITLDFDQTRAIPAYVSFVSPQAQFTPKQVETLTEREKLMFRVKLQVPRELAAQYIERIKTGVRGVGYVKLDPNVAWPARLQKLLTPPVASR